jgi:hypothetical protein
MLPDAVAAARKEGRCVGQKMLWEGDDEKREASQVLDDRQRRQSEHL